MVVRDHSAAAPPEARITARAAIARPSSHATPWTRPSAPASSARTRRPSSTSIRSSSTTSAESWRRIRRPVALPPACATRRMPCPPSSPSARVPCRSASNRTPSASSSAKRAGASDAQHLGGRAPDEAAAGDDRVLQVQGGRVVDGQRRGQAALRPVGGGLGERAGGDERDAGAGPGGRERCEQSGGPGADHDEFARRLRARRVRYRGCRPGSVMTPASRTTCPATPSGRHGSPRSRRRWSATAGSAGSAWRRRARPATSSRASTRSTTSTRSPGSRRAAAARSTWTRARSPARTRRRCAPRAARSRWSRRCWSTATRAGSPRCARPDTTPRRRGRWGSASSTTSRSARRTRGRRTAPSGCSSSTGTCTTATAPTTSSTPIRRCCSARSTSRRSTPGPARRRTWDRDRARGTP